MSRLLILDPAGVRIGDVLPDGAFRAARAPVPAPDLAAINAGQGDSRDRIKVTVPQAQAPSVTRWEGGALPALAAWRDSGGPAVVLMPQDDPSALADQLSGLRLIAIEFPRASDGRGYSLARLIRERMKWRGDLRAVGDVQIDQVFFFARCGFTSLALRGDQDPQAALRAAASFPDIYQSASDESRAPLFLRRGAA